jgi:iron complex outermembrane receptor protein
LANVDIKQVGFNVQSDYDLDFATLTAQLSYRRSDENSWTRGSAQLSFFQFLSRAKTAELRLTSNGNGPLKWVVGAFGFDEKQPSYGVVSADQSNPFGAGGTCDALNSTPNIPACGNYLPQFNLRTRSYAFFGQATWTPIDRLHITAACAIRMTSRTTMAPICAKWAAMARSSFSTPARTRRSPSTMASRRR